MICLFYTQAEMMGAPQTGPVSFTLTWADEIAALCHQTFNTLALQITGKKLTD